jgi:outer membrane protein
MDVPLWPPWRWGFSSFSVCPVARQLPILTGQSVGAIDRALADNPGLQAAQERQLSTERTAAATFRQHFGVVRAVAWGTRYKDDQILMPISKQLLGGGFGNLPFDRDQLHYGAAFELPLYVGGRLFAQSHLSDLKADEAAALLSGTRWQIRANVVSVYAANQSLAAAVRAYSEQVAALNKTRERLELMVNEGKAPEVDLLKVIETLQESRADLADAEAGQTEARALLAALLDLPVDQHFELDPLPDSLPTLPSGDIAWDELLDEATAVTVARLHVSQAESAKKIARSQFLPTLSFRGNLLEHIASSVNGQMETWELTLAVSLPVFTGGSRVATYQSASAAQRQAELELRQARRQRQAELEGAKAKFEASQTQLVAAQRRLVAGDEAARIEDVRYQTGAGTIEDLLRARTRATAAQAGLARAQGNVLTAAAQINAIVEREVVK